MDDSRADYIIEALEQMDLPPMPTNIAALIESGPPYLVELFRALAEDMEHPGKGTAALAALPPEARIIENALRDNPMLCFTGLLQESKKLRRLRQNVAMLERNAGHRLH
jgi:hypothetical protein